MLGRYTCIDISSLTGNTKILITHLVEFGTGKCTCTVIHHLEIITDGNSRILKVTGDHNCPDTCLLTYGDRRLSFFSLGIDHTDKSDKDKILLV